MDYYLHIAANFQQAIEAIAMSVDSLAPPIERSSKIMAQALIHERKIIACGNGSDAALAQLFVSNMLNCLEHDRPALPAMTLCADAVSLTAIASSSLSDVYARQIRALGQPGDVLLCIASAEGHNNLLQAIQAAHDRNMEVVLLSNAGSDPLRTLIQSEDAHIPVEAPRQTRVVELQTMVIQSLCELIEQSLFGSYHQE